MEALSALAGDTPGAFLLLAVILIASLVGLFASPTLIERCLFRPYWLVRNNEWATLVTSAFVHADLPHLIFNAFTFWASGAILAVLFASIVYTPTSSIFILPIPVPIPAPLFALGYLAYTWYASRQARGRVNHDAHLGGALAGIAFVALTDWPAIERAWRIVAG